MCPGSHWLRGTGSSFASKPQIRCSTEKPPAHSWNRWRRARCPKLRTELAASAILAILLGTGCRQDMQDQPKYIPLRPTDFFDDHRSARPLPEYTIARGHLNADTEFYTGKQGDEPTKRFPFPVTRD